jgi:ribosomal protein S12 methylthiotransferase
MLVLLKYWLYFGALHKEWLCSYAWARKDIQYAIQVERRFMKTPKVGFVSLGCPKALVDSERILTQLKTEGYQVASDYDGADLVVVNTCGFIESAVQESLDAIGEAMSENGRVIVTGCLGKDEDKIRQMHPNVKVTGAAAYQDVMEAVHEYVPAPPKHNPFIDLVPEQGVRLHRNIMLI